MFDFLKRNQGNDGLPVIGGFPPNYDVILMAIPEVADNHAVIFTYDGAIYNPYGKEITQELQIHEAVHVKQQGSDPDGWWIRYLKDKQFRLEQEAEAYGEQYHFAKIAVSMADEAAQKEGKHLSAGKNNLLKWGLESMALALSGPSYGNLISYGEAEARIRNFGRAD
jgi:hypothetical protein